MTNEERGAAQDQPRALTYDPAFRHAVESGFLTPLQAFQRGRRDNCASRLAAKHGLTHELALSVTDNRLSLGQALRKQRSPGDDPVERRERKGRIRVAWVALGVPLILFVSAAAWRFSTTSAQVGAQSGLSASVLTDSDGRVTRVEGADPKSVLETYCEATKADAPCEPVGLLQAARASTGLRVGVFVDPNIAERLLAIPIRKNMASGRWRAGDGESPLSGLLAPHNAAASIEREADEDDPTRRP